MKNFFVFITASILLIGCKTNNKTEQPAEQPATNTTEVQTQPVSDNHNAKNSLDYKGTYKGTLPTASGEGMEVIITLADSTYTKDIVYVGKNTKPLQEKGSYTWNEEGNTITLENASKPNQYFIAEGKIIQLDMDGNKITGDLSDKYILAKQ